MLAFQPRGFGFEPVRMRYFFNKFSKAEGSHFFQHYETPNLPFRLCETFFEKFSIFEYCKREYLTLVSLFATFEPWIWRRLGSVPACCNYTYDKQVLWERAGAFFPRDNSLVSAGKSHSSGARGLVVRRLLFNPEGSGSNPCVCANFLTSFPKQKVLIFSAL